MEPQWSPAAARPRWGCAERKLPKVQVGLEAASSPAGDPGGGAPRVLLNKTAASRLFKGSTRGSLKDVHGPLVNGIMHFYDPQKSG